MPLHAGYAWLHTVATHPSQPCQSWTRRLRCARLYRILPRRADACSQPAAPPLALTVRGTAVVSRLRAVESALVAVALLRGCRVRLRNACELRSPVSSFLVVAP